MTIARLTLHELDSHPISKELGFSSQEGALSYKIDMDFTQGKSDIKWQWGVKPQPKDCLPFFDRSG